MPPGLESDGFHVGRGIVPQTLIDDALRLLHVDLLENGHSAETLGEWLWAMHWFPHLNYHDEILALATALPDEWQDGVLCGRRAAATRRSWACRSRLGGGRTAACS